MCQKMPSAMDALRQCETPLGNGKRGPYNTGWKAVAHGSARIEERDPHPGYQGRLRARPRGGIAYGGDGRTPHRHHGFAGTPERDRLRAARRARASSVISPRVSDLERYKVCEDHFRDWLRSGMTGCYFASMLAAKLPVRMDFYAPIGRIDHEQMEAFID